MFLKLPFAVSFSVLYIYACIFTYIYTYIHYARCENVVMLLLSLCSYIIEERR